MNSFKGSEQSHITINDLVANIKQLAPLIMR